MSENSIGFGAMLIETLQDEIKEKDAEIDRLRAENTRLVNHAVDLANKLEAALAAKDTTHS